MNKSPKFNVKLLPEASMDRTPPRTAFLRLQLFTVETDAEISVLYIAHSKFAGFRSVLLSGARFPDGRKMALRGDERVWRVEIDR